MPMVCMYMPSFRMIVCAKLSQEQMPPIILVIKLFVLKQTQVLRCFMAPSPSYKTK